MIELTSAYDCARKDLISYVSYPSERKTCYSYPRFAYDYDDLTLVPVPESLFPDVGALQVNIAGGFNSDDLYAQYGSLVVMSINRTDEFENIYYGQSDYSRDNKYRGVINPTFSRGASVIEFTKLSNHPLSNSLAQIIDVQESVSLTKPVDEPFHLMFDSAMPETKFVFVSRNIPSGKAYFGPFETTTTDQGIKLRASSRFGSRIVRVDARYVDGVIAVQDENGFDVAEFMPAHHIARLFATAEPEDVYDWISDKELIDAAAEAISGIEEAESLTKAQFRSLKASVMESLESSTRIDFDDERMRRVEELFAVPERWAALPAKVANTVIETAGLENLARTALDDASCRKKILESKGVTEYVAQERARYDEAIASLRQERDSVQAELTAVQDDLERTKRDREEQLAEMRQTLASEMAGLEKRKEELLTDISEAEAACSQALADKEELSKQVDQIFAGIDDHITASGKILESEILQRVVASVSGASLAPDGAVTVAAPLAFRDDEDELTDAQIVDWLHESIAGRYGRQLSRNDVVNCCICLMQGYITMFAGNPGSGKTSLCNILSAALGLKGEAAGSGRFAEINVEKGWTSIKDYIGYFNPLTKTYERADAATYRAFELLNREASENLEDVAPYVFLLHEANLSPIEHYWAPFLRACDTFDETPALLSLGGSEDFKVPGYVRFLATVNFDHTTETLSPRFLDRCWVVSLNSGMLEMGLDSRRVNVEELAEAERPFSYRRLMQVFGRKDDASFDPALVELYEKVLRICREHGFNVSMRSQRMMGSYLSAAVPLMDTDARDSQFAPLDYAISEKILPQIVGPAEKLSGLVEALREALAELPRCRVAVEKMKAEGEQNGFIQFFA